MNYFVVFVLCFGLAKGLYQGQDILQGLTEVGLRLMSSTELDFQRNFKSLTTRNLRYDPDVSSYFDLLPTYEGALNLDQTFKMSGACFQDISVHMWKQGNGEVKVIFDLQESQSLLCTEALIIATDTQYFVKDFLISGNHEVTFKAPETDAESWDLYERGPRIFSFPMGLSTAISNLGSTLGLFEPCLTEKVANIFAQMNLNFLRDNVGIVMEPRDSNTPEILPIDQNLIMNGDTFDIMRLDGLDPMIAWAMGSATGHTAIALWKENQLYLCESNAKSPYWPVNGIQCNTYDDWMEFGRRNGYNVVWAPLDRELSANFDIDAAWAFVDEHLGVDYGWEVVLMGLLDTAHGNEICTDTARQNCVIAEHFELIFSIAEKYSTDAARVFKPAIMQRADVDFELPIVEAYYSAFVNQGILPKDLHLIPENDTWTYPTLRNGEPFESDVSICNVFTCKVLREGGVFGDIEFNCGEVSVNDMYRLKIYEENFERPEVCIEWDPENPLCQVLGKYKLRLDTQPGTLPRYNYVEPYDGFANACPALAPDYTAPLDC